MDPSLPALLWYSAKIGQAKKNLKTGNSEAILAIIVRTLVNLWLILATDCVQYVEV